MSKEKGKTLVEGVAIARGNGTYGKYSDKKAKMRGIAAKQGCYKMGGK